MLCRLSQKVQGYESAAAEHGSLKRHPAQVQQRGGYKQPQVRPVWVRMRLHQPVQELQAAVCQYSRIPMGEWVFFSASGQRCKLLQRCAAKTYEAQHAVSVHIRGVQSHA